MVHLSCIDSVNENFSVQLYLRRLCRPSFSSMGNHSRDLGAAHTAHRGDPCEGSCVECRYAFRPDDAVASKPGYADPAACSFDGTPGPTGECAAGSSKRLAAMQRSGIPH